ncbi:MAG: phosphopantothenoylcysteine decarboxylase [Wenzhouxiangella sp.]
MRVLVTAGGTEEPIDGVRFIGNASSGATGLAIARALEEHGCQICLLHNWRVAVAGLACQTIAFRTFDDLALALQAQLQRRHFDAVVHLAAVSDYRLVAIELDGEPRPAGADGKIASGHNLMLRLAPNPKLLDSLRRWSSNPVIRVVAFKLTHDADPVARRQAVEELFVRGAADIVVHNDLAEIGPEHHQATIHRPAGPVATTHTRSGLARRLVHLLDQDGRA